MGTLPRAAQLYVAIVIGVGLLSFVALLPAHVSAAVSVRRPAGLGVPDLGLEGQPADPAGERLDAVGLVRRESDGAAAARARARGAHRGRRRAGRSARTRSSSRYPLYRTVFSMAAEAITMAATGLVYVWLGGSTGRSTSSALAKPLVGAIATYFFVNTGLVAGAIAFSTRQRAHQRLARRLPVERRQLHGRRHRRRDRGGRRSSAASTGRRCCCSRRST